jgi:hypothetical protein
LPPISWHLISFPLPFFFLAVKIPAYFPTSLVVMCNLSFYCTTHFALHDMFYGRFYFFSFFVAIFCGSLRSADRLFSLPLHALLLVAVVVSSHELTWMILILVSSLPSLPSCPPSQPTTHPWCHSG